MSISSEEKQKLHRLGQLEAKEDEDRGFVESLLAAPFRGPSVNIFESDEDTAERDAAYKAGRDNYNSQ